VVNVPLFDSKTCENERDEEHVEYAAFLSAKSGDPKSNVAYHYEECQGKFFFFKKI